MIAMVIIGILATFAVPQIQKIRERISKNTTQGLMATIEGALINYKEELGHFPTQKEGGLDALVTRPVGKDYETKWQGPYIKGATVVPKDGWGHDFIYNLAPNIQKKDRFRYYEIISYGPNNDANNESEHLYMGE